MNLATSQTSMREMAQGELWDLVDPVGAYLVLPPSLSKGAAGEGRWHADETKMSMDATLYVIIKDK